MSRKVIFAFLAIALMALLAVTCAGVEELTDASGQWKYVLEDGGATITGYVEEPSGDLKIPRKLDRYAVMGIGDSAFMECVDLTSVTISNRVKSIGDEAFSGCESLLRVIIPDSVSSIGDLAFNNCESLISATIPASVTNIGTNPFSYCPLRSINVSADNPVYEQIDGVLFDKQQKMLISFPRAKRGDCIIPEGVESIGDLAFSECGYMTSVTIPDSVTSIGDMAFYECSGLTGINIPDSVTSIGEGAFAYCGRLASITIPNSVTSIGFWAFSGCGALTSVTLPDRITSIGDRMFAHCGLTSVTIPASVADIGKDAFIGCTELILSVIEGSFAEQYAKDNGIVYTIIE